VKKWDKLRRPEILKLFKEEVYGKVPGDLKVAESTVWEEDDEVFDGLAKRKQVGLTFRRNDKEVYLELLMYLPNNVDTFGFQLIQI